ncbi:F-box protein SKIP19-like [Bidens hawaiensis]|uniref:F-box protein SKIP19-like n=1 Tax=Bidens hawaiensis TaxID=980011 RepID=UPI0040497F93
MQSNLNRRRSKIVSKPKQPLRVSEPTRNWLELSSDVTVNILQRIDGFDILDNAQNVCTAWCEICKDPAMWRVVYMDRSYSAGKGRLECRDMCMQAVDRSQGQLVDLTVIGFCDDELLQFIVDRSSQLRRLEIVLYAHDYYDIWSVAFKKLPLLEELSLVETKIWKNDFEAAGRYCPLLKTLKLNKRAVRYWEGDDSIALAIGKNLPELTHLEFIGNIMTNTGLLAILDGYCNLELLDLRRSLYVDLKGDLGKRCSEQIKNLRLPKDSFEGFPYTRYVLYGCDSDDEYKAYLDFDEYTAYGDDPYDNDDKRVR